jgi:hypothetical protein
MSPIHINLWLQPRTGHVATMTERTLTYAEALDEINETAVEGWQYHQTVVVSGNDAVVLDLSEEAERGRLAALREAREERDFRHPVGAAA